MKEAYDAYFKHTASIMQAQVAAKVNQYAAAGQDAPVATILAKDITDFYKKREDLLRDIFMDKLAGDMTKWKVASGAVHHQVIIKGPKGWSIVGNQNEGQLVHDGKVIYRATTAEYSALKPMAVTVVQVLQRAMDNEIERLKTSLVEDLDVEETYDNSTLPSFLLDTKVGSGKSAHTAYTTSVTEGYMRGLGIIS